MLETRGCVFQREEGIDKLIPEEFLERRSYEKTTLLKNQASLKGKVIIQDEEQGKAEAER